MYLWKCWRDTRSTFLVLAGAVAAVGAFAAYAYYDPFGWIAAKPEWPRQMWQATAQAFMLSTVGIVPVAGFVLGSRGVGAEFERKTADFLLTRPHSRRYFLWTSWGLGAAQMAALMTLALVASWLAPFPGAPSRTARTLIGMWIIALVIYSVTYLMTTLVRNSRDGLSLGVLVMVAYMGLLVWLKLSYELSIPNVWDLSFRSGRASLPFTAALGWTAVCLALTFAAQLKFERQEA